MRQLTSVDTQFLPLENSRVARHLAPGAPMWNLVVSNLPGPQLPPY